MTNIVAAYTFRLVSNSLVYRRPPFVVIKYLSTWPRQSQTRPLHQYTRYPQSSSHDVLRFWQQKTLPRCAFTSGMLKLSTKYGNLRALRSHTWDF